MDDPKALFNKKRGSQQFGDNKMAAANSMRSIAPTGSSGAAAAGGDDDGLDDLDTSGLFGGGATAAGEPSKQDADSAWERQQIKAFTAWVNMHLRKREPPVKITDLSTDLSDGRHLLALMEEVGDCQLAKPGRGKMRIHKIQNINAALEYIKSQGVRVTASAEEIADHNLTTILGMIWTLILRFDIQDLSLDGLAAKDALLLWCQRKTNGYEGVAITNFHKSWKSGLAFCALIHKHRPDLLDFASLDKKDALGNLTLALDVAEKHLDIPKMLDPEDLVMWPKPDERSVMTQVAAFYKCFASFQGDLAASKIATALKCSQEHERLIEEYETMASTLLEWIPVAVATLNERPGLNSVDECLEKMKSLVPFRSEEYPCKLSEKAVLEAHYSSLQTRLRLSGRSPYVPTEGKLIEQINTMWGTVDTADSENKTWTVGELRRNKLCEQKAKVFAKKAAAHEAWAEAQAAKLSEDNYSSLNLGALNAMQKQHEAFKHELTAKEAIVTELASLAAELATLGYSGKEETSSRSAAVQSVWAKIQGLATERDADLQAAVERQQKLETLWLDIAMKSAPLNAELDEFIDRLDAEIFADTEEDVALLGLDVAQLKDDIETKFEPQYDVYKGVVAQAEELMGSSGSTENPFAVHSQEEIAGKHAQVQELAASRAGLLAQEASKQKAREELRKRWAEAAQQSITVVAGLIERAKGINLDTHTELETQLEMLGAIRAETEGHTDATRSLEALSKELEAELIFDNVHSKLTIEMVRGDVQRCGTTISAVEASVQNQILTRDSTNITDAQMEEFRTSFAHFDKDKSGFLDRTEFRGCLLSLGIDIPQKVPEEGDDGDDAEFERIFNRCDDGDGKVSFAEFVAFMAEEMQDAETQDDLLQQFKALASGQPYILADQLNELEPELKQYCLDSMGPFEGGPEGALDYEPFVAAVFGASAEL